MATTRRVADCGVSRCSLSSSVPLSNGRDPFDRESFESCHLAPQFSVRQARLPTCHRRSGNLCNSIRRQRWAFPRRQDGFVRTCMKGEWLASFRYTFRDRQAKEEADVAFEVIKTVKRKPPVRGDERGVGSHVPSWAKGMTASSPRRRPMGRYVRSHPLTLYPPPTRQHR